MLLCVSHSRDLHEKGGQGKDEGEDVSCATVKQQCGYMTGTVIVVYPETMPIGTSAGVPNDRGTVPVTIRRSAFAVFDLLGLTAAV